METKAVCASCQREIDAAAKLCPYCGADPVTGERVDTQAILQEIFTPKQLTTSETVLEYARQRQGLFIAGSILAVFLLLAVLHQFVTMRNSNAVTDAPAVPLTEIADVTTTADRAAAEMPELDFVYDGRPQTMRTFIVEPGATPPPQVVAAQQQAAQQAAANRAAAAGRAAPQQRPGAAARPPQQPGGAAPRPRQPITNQQRP